VTRLLTVAALGLCLATSSARAQERAPLDVVVVLDISGSMRAADPRRLSQFAVEVLAHFLDDDDRLAVVPLGGRDVATIPLARVRDHRPTLGEQLQAFTYAGGTPCLPALRRADALLAEAGGDPAQQVIVFMTDGVCHEGQRDKAERDRDLFALATRLGGEGRRIFGVPLGREADVATVRVLGEVTHAEWHAPAVDDARQLPAIFARLSAGFRLTEAREVPLGLGAAELPLDPYLRRVTLLATTESSPIALGDVRSPSDLAPATPPVGGRFPRTGRSYSGFAILKLERPERGTWRLRVDAEAAPVAVVVYDYDLRATLSIGPEPEAEAEPDVPPRALVAGEPAVIRATLETPAGEPVSAAFLRDVSGRLEVREPGADTWRDLGPLDFDGLGALTQRSAFEHLGRYLFRVRLTRGASLDLRGVATAHVGPVIRDLLPPGATQRCLDPEAPNTFEIALRDALGAPIGPAALTRDAAAELSLWAAPEGASLARIALFEPAAEDAWRARWRPPGPATYRYEVRVTTPEGLDARSPVATATAARFDLRAAEVAPLGELRPGDAHALTLDLSGSTATGSVTLSLDRGALALPEGVTVDAAPLVIGPDGPRELPITVRVAEGCAIPDGALTGTWRLTAAGPCVPDGLALDVGAAAATVRARTFWECWGTVILAALGALLFLLWLLHAVRCAGRAHRFPSSLRVQHGVEADDLFPIDLGDARSRRSILIPGRCRSERLYWNEVNATFGRTRDPTWYLEAAGGSSVQIVAPAGTRVEVAPAGAPSRFRPIGVAHDPAGSPDGDAPAPAILQPTNPAEIYRIGQVHFRVE